MTRGNGEQSMGGPAGTGGGFRRWLPLVAIAAAMIAAFASGAHRYLSFETIGLNYEALRGLIGAHMALALLAYVLVYIVVVALSLPGALVLTLSGGLLFGWQLGSFAAVIGATIGATIVFLIARTSLGAALAEKAGPAVEKLREGFQENAFSYLLFLRLVPAFPFFLVNLAPSLLGMKLSSYVLATFIGIIPGGVAFSIAGSGLGSVVEAQNAAYKACLARSGGMAAPPCVYSIDTSRLVTKELLLAFAALGVVALIPVVMKSLAAHRGATSRSRSDAR